MLGQPPPAAVLSFLAELRCEPESDEGSTADEGVPTRGTGYCGHGPSPSPPPLSPPMHVGYTARDHCDGQPLASMGRWPPSQRWYPNSTLWKAIVNILRKYADTYCSADVLVSLALGKVTQCPFSADSVTDLKNSIIAEASESGCELRRVEGDRRDVPIDLRFMDLLLMIAGDQEVGLGFTHNVFELASEYGCRRSQRCTDGSDARVLQNKQTHRSTSSNTRTLNLR